MRPRTFAMYADPRWLAMVDDLAGLAGAVSRAELIERLVAGEAERRAVRVVPRLEPSKFSPWARADRDPSPAPA